MTTETDGPDPIDTGRRYEVAARNGADALRVALARAAFLLRRSGTGQFDREQAEVLEHIHIIKELRWTR